MIPKILYEGQFAYGKIGDHRSFVIFLYFCLLLLRSLSQMAFYFSNLILQTALFKMIVPINDAAQCIDVEIFGEGPPFWHHDGNWFKFTGFDMLHDIDAK